jgi:hypothetical protein
MPGAVMDLLAYGTQNLMLSGVPEITFWNMTYKQYTNFAVESIEITFNGQADFGRRVSAIMSRVGDLAYRTYLQVTLPMIGQGLTPAGGKGIWARWLDYIGEQLIAMVEIDIGGQRIDRHYGDFMHIWNQLTLDSEAKKKYYKMIGHTTQLTYLVDPQFAEVNGPCSGTSGPAQVCAPRQALPETTLYIPLLFWFCKNPGLALPLLALQFSEVKITVDFRPIAECLWAVTDLAETNNGRNVAAANAYNQSLASASIYVDYVFLDIDERTRLAAEPADYLITQLMYPGEESVGTSTARVKLNLNHPVKELIFVVQPDVNTDYCGSMQAGSTLFKLLGAQPFNYTDALDALPNSVAAFGAPAATNGPAGVIDGSGLFAQAGANGAQAAGLPWGLSNMTTTATGFVYSPFGNAAQGMTLPAESSVSDAGTFVLAETALNMHCYGVNPVVVAKIQLNGGDRFSEREGTYFDQVQPFQHHTGSGETGINVYSFALRPQDDQPSGTCNFSRIDNAILQLVLSANAVQNTATAKVRYYAVNINSLRVTGGVAGPAWAA